MNLMAKTLAILLVSAFLVPVCLTAAASPRPLVLWHGLGDSYASPGMLEFASMIKNVHPGIFVHSVYIEEELDKDRQAGFVRVQSTNCLGAYYPKSSTGM